MQPAIWLLLLEVSLLRELLQCQQHRRAAESWKAEELPGLLRVLAPLRLDLVDPPLGDFCCEVEVLSLRSDHRSRTGSAALRLRFPSLQRVRPPNEAILLR